MAYGGHAFGFWKQGQNRTIEFQNFYDHRDEVLPWIKEYSPYEQAKARVILPLPRLPRKTSPPSGVKSKRDPTHSAVLGLLLEEKVKEVGVESHLNYPGHADPDYANGTSFLIAKLKAARP